MGRRHNKLPQGIDKLPSGKYRVRIYYEGKKHGLGTFDTLTDAQTAYTIAKADIARTTFLPPKEREDARRIAEHKKKRQQITLDEAARAFLQWLEDTGRAKGTIYSYESRYRVHIAPVLGSMQVNEITPEDVHEWHMHTKRSASSGVPRNAYMTLAAIMNWCCGKARGQSRSFEPIITESPCQESGATRHRPVREKGRAATVEQVLGLVGQVPPKYRAAVVIAGFAGLRIGEVSALTLGDITTRNDRLLLHVSKQVQARGKGTYLTDLKTANSRRTLPLPAIAVPFVEDHIENLPATDSDTKLFPPGERAVGEWMHPNTLRTVFNAARATWDAENPGKRLGESFTFHSLRHTCLTLLAEHGATIAELQLAAGHADIQTVAVYQHANVDRLGRIGDSMKPEEGSE